MLLLDTIGELGGLFRFAKAVFMGGSLATRGGHNVLEPAAFGKPVIVGPHMENFRAIADRFPEAGALIEIAGPAELAPRGRQRACEASCARRESGPGTCLKPERGATDRAVGSARELFGTPGRARSCTGRCGRCCGCCRWSGGGGALDRTFTRRLRLATPVISVGGLAMGGAGKTPLVRWLARRLSERGYEVAILMRGYGSATGRARCAAGDAGPDRDYRRRRAAVPA